MSATALLKSLLAIGLSLVLLALSSTSGQTLSGITPTVRITSVSGYDGHAFVYAEVNVAGIPFPAPTGTTHQSPYYAQWLRQPSGLPSCPWIWAVYVFDRATGTQVNLPPPNGATWNFGTTNSVCASPSGTPVDQPAEADASARLDLDLNTTVVPAVALVGSPRTITAALASALTQDLDLYLNLAIRDWSVTTWSVDFGDGQAATVDGRAGTAIQLTHSYAAPGSYQVRAIAFISGEAQAAIYDRYGNVRLIARPFTVAIGNHALASVRAQEARRYVPPQAEVTVTPSLTGTESSAGAPGFRHIEALRGSLTTLTVHLRVVQEGWLSIGGAMRGVGLSRLTAWRLDGLASDAPATAGTVPGRVHAVSDALVLQWNTPDPIQRAQPQDYSVPITLFVTTHYSDGHVASYVIPSSFSVTVDFAAESG